MLNHSSREAKTSVGDIRRFLLTSPSPVRECYYNDRNRSVSSGVSNCECLINDKMVESVRREHLFNSFLIKFVKRSLLLNGMFLLICFAMVSSSQQRIWMKLRKDTCEMSRWNYHRGVIEGYRILINSNQNYFHRGTEEIKNNNFTIRNYYEDDMSVINGKDQCSRTDSQAKIYFGHAEEICKSQLAYSSSTNSSSRSFENILNFLKFSLGYGMNNFSIFSVSVRLLFRRGIYCSCILTTTLIVLYSFIKINHLIILKNSKQNEFLKFLSYLISKFSKIGFCLYLSLDLCLLVMSVSNLAMNGGLNIKSYSFPFDFWHQIFAFLVEYHLMFKSKREYWHSDWMFRLRDLISNRPEIITSLPNLSSFLSLINAIFNTDNNNLFHCVKMMPVEILKSDDNDFKSFFIFCFFFSLLEFLLFLWRLQILSTALQFSSSSTVTLNSKEKRKWAFLNSFKVQLTLIAPFCIIVYCTGSFVLVFFFGSLPSCTMQDGHWHSEDSNMRTEDRRQPFKIVDIRTNHLDSDRFIDNKTFSEVFGNHSMTTKQMFETLLRRHGYDWRSQKRKSYKRKTKNKNYENIIHDNNNYYYSHQKDDKGFESEGLTHPLLVSSVIPIRDVNGTVGLAADVYFPMSFIKRLIDQDVSNEQKAPTFLSITRYNRRMQVRWPFASSSFWQQPAGLSTSVWNWPFISYLTFHGYVVVMVDSRGTGASFGSREFDFSDREIDDMRAILKFVTDSFWFDGNVAAGGVSYDGMTGMHLASLPEAEGVVKAVIALYTPVRVMKDLLLPGGLVCSAFVSDYAGLTENFEKKGSPRKHFRNVGIMKLPWHVIVGFEISFGKAFGVRGNEEELEDNLYKSHSHNWRMADHIHYYLFSDDEIKFSSGGGVVMNGLCDPASMLSSFHLIRKLTANTFPNDNSSRVSSSSNSAQIHQARKSAAQDQKSKLKEPLKSFTFGPWGHSGRRGCPVGDLQQGSWPCFEKQLHLNLVLFLDCELFGKCGNENSTSSSTAVVHFLDVETSEWVHMSAENFLRSSGEQRLKLYLTDETGQEDAEDNGSNISFGRGSYKDDIPKNVALNKMSSVISWNDILVHWKRRDWTGIFHSSSDLLSLMILRMKTRKDNSNKIRNIFKTYERGQKNPTVDSSEYLSRFGLSFSTRSTFSSKEDKNGYITFRPDYDSSPLGYLSKWQIVQHTSRIPLDSSFAIQESLDRENLISTQHNANDRNFKISSKKIKHSIISFTSPPFNEDVMVSGSIAVQIPVLIEMQNSFPSKEDPLLSAFKISRNNSQLSRLQDFNSSQVWDMSMFASLFLVVPGEFDGSRRERRVHLTDGRTLASHSTRIRENKKNEEIINSGKRAERIFYTSRFAQDLQSVPVNSADGIKISNFLANSRMNEIGFHYMNPDDVPNSSRMINGTGLPMFTQSLLRSDHAFPSERIMESYQQERNSGGHQLDLFHVFRMNMDVIIRRIPKHSRLILLLYGSDESNFEWRTTRESLLQYLIARNYTTGTDTVKRPKEMKIILSRNTVVVLPVLKTV